MPYTEIQSEEIQEQSPFQTLSPLEFFMGMLAVNEEAAKLTGEKPLDRKTIGQCVVYFYERKGIPIELDLKELLLGGGRLSKK